MQNLIVRREEDGGEEVVDFLREDGRARFEWKETVWVLGDEMRSLRFERRDEAYLMFWG